MVGASDNGAHGNSVRECGRKRLRKAGRPPSGHEMPERATARMYSSQLHDLDAWAEKRGLSRADAMRQLIAIGLRVGKT